MINGNTSQSTDLPYELLHLHVLSDIQMDKASLKNCAQKGFSLIEILVSIVILSFGLLGIVGLQASSMKANREARLQSTGVKLAEEIAELIRGNHSTASKTQATENPYLIDYKSTATNATSPACGIQGKAKCSDGAEIAARDIADWWSRVNNPLAGGMPGARAVICFDSAPYDGEGLPQWDCNGSGTTLAIKIGWTRSNTLKGATGSDAANTSSVNTGAFDKALRPAVIIPVTPGVL